MKREIARLLWLEVHDRLFWVGCYSLPARRSRKISITHCATANAVVY